MKSEGKEADISEVFSSIQGEGIFVGTRQIFVRFWGCNLKCAFCDLSSSLSSRKVSVKELISRIRRLDKIKGPHHSISLTGGEPLLQIEYLKQFLPPLKDRGFKLYLETNGTLPQNLRPIVELIDIIAMDMKLPSSTQDGGCWREHKRFLEISRKVDVFVKMVITGSTSKEDVKKAVRIVKDIDPSVPLVLQPLTPNRKVKRRAEVSQIFNFQSMVEAELEDVRVIPQVHKIMGIR